MISAGRGLHHPSPPKLQKIQLIIFQLYSHKAISTILDTREREYVGNGRPLIKLFMHRDKTRLSPLDHAKIKLL